jgi:hypothetical protein
MQNERTGSVQCRLILLVSAGSLLACMPRCATLGTPADSSARESMTRSAPPPMDHRSDDHDQQNEQQRWASGTAEGRHTGMRHAPSVTEGRLRIVALLDGEAARPHTRAQLWKAVSEEPVSEDR